MIVTFSIENFLSFNEEETFSMVASNRFSGHHENHLAPIPGSDVKVLRGGVLYGANDAGKSNFFKALYYLKKIACNGRKKGAGTGRRVFRFREDPEASKKWKRPIRDWKAALNQFVILYGDRVPIEQ